MTARVLVVDDEPAVNDLICDALRLSGFRTDSAADGFEALQFLRGTTVDLVILDINMPRVDGFETLSRMREGGDRTPVIFLHGNNDTPFPTACNPYGRMQAMAQHLADNGYATSELWGLGYQGDQCDLVPTTAEPDANSKRARNRNCASAMIK